MSQDFVGVLMAGRTRHLWSSRQQVQSLNDSNCLAKHKMDVTYMHKPHFLIYAYLF